MAKEKGIEGFKVTNKHVGVIGGEVAGTRVHPLMRARIIHEEIKKPCFLENADEQDELESRAIRSMNCMARMFVGPHATQLQQGDLSKFASPSNEMRRYRFFSEHLQSMLASSDTALKMQEIEEKIDNNPVDVTPSERQQLKSFYLSSH